MDVIGGVEMDVIGGVENVMWQGVTPHGRWCRRVGRIENHDRRL